MLQGLRRKIGGSITPVSEHVDEIEGQKLQEDATRLEAAVWQFNRQDRALRRLEMKMRQMLDQIQVAVTSMTTVVDIFMAICSNDDERDYKAAMKQIEQEDIERMEQSIRFTILDPLQARLERYDELKQEIHTWEKLQAESKMLRAVTLKIHSSRLEKDANGPYIEIDLYRVATLLQETETLLLPRLEDVVQSGAITAAALFKTTRLQTAIFFQNANQSIQSSLSRSEQEIVVEAHQAFQFAAAMRYNPPCISLSSKLSKQLSSVSDGWSELDGSSSSTELDGVEAISGSDEDDETQALSITSDDFEAGRVLRASKSTKLGAEQQLVRKLIDSSERVALGAYQMVTRDGENNKRMRGKNADSGQASRLQCSTSPWPRTASVKPRTPQRTSMLSSIRKTIWGKLNHASGEARMFWQIPASVPDTSTGADQSAVDSPKKRNEQLHIIPQSPKHWLAIENCLWELDVREARSPVNVLLQTDLISSDADDILSRLLQEDDSLYSECLSYLFAEDLARLSKVNFRLHSCLIDSAPIWKKCIRSGGLSPNVRSSLWLSLFYESTPWQYTASTSHYLSADRRRSMYDQLLLKVGTKLAAGCIAEESPLVDDDAQLAIWFREIDVDVVRTCHRSMYAKVKPRTFLPIPTAAVDKLNDDSVESFLQEMVKSIGRTEMDDTFASRNSHTSACTNVSSTDVRNLDLEAKMRRVLRAYVMYNPRVGYCQGMGFLVRFLAEVAQDEADIFWLFVGFSEPKNDQNLYEPGMAVLQPYLAKFELQLSTHMPTLYTHFQAEGVDVGTFCTRWFLTFFSSFETLAPALVTRLLDIFIIDGWRIMFSFSLVILDELQQQLLTCDMEGILRILQSPRSYMPEPDHSRERQLVRHALAFSITRAMIST
ncbi:unnamed protein product [Peronospora belbahrii]|uniref:Rab-GAP TBC domain-containing protein n=1 Tax=Peronospora belbahrii TaxID=622444 RepID=A0AAU9KRX3_9STRA|nr:unnamed protein product [Peronospora belbahrii]CAH0518354.1 unnamed protein product [Peronospora belbahrii]